MAPTYSLDAYRAISFLKRSQNDVEIYVEDSTIANAYVLLIKKWLPKTVKFESVVSIGPRDLVLKACSVDQTDRKRKRLYIVDGDLDLIMNVPKPKLKHLYRLNAYCLENVVMHPAAVESVMFMFAPGADRNTLVKQLDWKISSREFSSAFGSLFVVYALIQELLSTGRPKTVQTSVFSLCSKNAEGFFQPDSQKILKHCRSLLLVLNKNVNKATFRAKRRMWLARAKSNPVGWPNLISGKDYLQRYLAQLLKHKVDCSLKPKQLTALLAAHCPVDIEKGLQIAIKKMLNN